MLIPIPRKALVASTFPGAIVARLAQYLIVRFTATPVVAVRWFEPEIPAGTVVAGPTSAAWKAALIGLGSFLLITALGIAFAFRATLQVTELGEMSGIDFLQVWLGVAIAVHAVPATEEIHRMWSDMAGGRSATALKLLTAPLSLPLYLLTYGFHQPYGVAVTIGVPLFFARG